MNVADRELNGLSNTYSLLARLWMREIDEPLLKELLRDPLCDVFTAAGGCLPGRSDAAALQELAVDYCQLFVGPANHLPPYQSVWQRGLFQRESADSMKQYAESIGYQADGLMLDHLGVQLDVMAQLLEIRMGAAEHSSYGFDLVAHYVFEHLTWADPMLDLATRRAKTNFYRSTIRMTREFLDSERRFWGTKQGGPNS